MVGAHRHVDAGLAAVVFSSLFVSSGAINTNPANVQVLGDVYTTNVERTGCMSTGIASQVLWTCGDTQPVKNGAAQFPIIANTAAWSGFDNGGVPSLEQSGLIMEPFYPFAPDECNNNTAGLCPDGTYWSGGPSSPPLITTSFPNGYVSGFTWLSKVHVNGLTVINNPTPTSLYSISWDPALGSTLPNVTLVAEEFISGQNPSYGTYGGVVQNGTAYLYGLLTNGSVALAKASTNAVNDLSQYQFYVNGAWTQNIPSSNDSSAVIPNVGTGSQGTIFYSEYWSSYVWIGGTAFVGAGFFISTSPNPEGPWTKPVNFYTAQAGNASITGHTCLAHPGLTNGTGQDIYLSFTNNTVYTNGSLSSTPLIHVQWAAVEDGTAPAGGNTSSSTSGPGSSPGSSSGSSSGSSGAGGTSPEGSNTSVGSTKSTRASTAGIAVGAAIGGLFIIGVLLALFWKLHRRHAGPNQAPRAQASGLSPFTDGGGGSESIMLQSHNYATAASSAQALVSEKSFVAHPSSSVVGTSGPSAPDDSEPSTPAVNVHALQAEVEAMRTQIERLQMEREVPWTREADHHLGAPPPDYYRSDTNSNPGTSAAGTSDALME